MSRQLIGGNLLFCSENPLHYPKAVQALPGHGILVVEGHIAQIDTLEHLLQQYPDIPPHLHHDCLIVPGLIDTHIHYAQIDVIASWGTQLLDWLERYTFPAEMAFADAKIAQENAVFFLDQLQRHGTTTALVFATSHTQSVNAFFAEAQKRNLRMLTGKVLMDRNAPQALCDTAESGYRDSLALIERWHGRQRLNYALTPRFAPTSSEAQLALAGKLLQQYPDLYMQTHLAENRNECHWVQTLFPKCKNYLDVYDQARLLSRRSVFAHCLHLQDSELQRLAATQSSIAHCPCSNTFIGSGLLPLNRIQQHAIHIGLGSDIGGGESFSLLRNASEAYKVQQLQGRNLSPAEMLYMATLGGARALDMGDKIGSIEVGKEADFTVLNNLATPLMARRSASTHDLLEHWFQHAILGDERHVKGIHILGEWRGNAANTAHQ